MMRAVASSAICPAADPRIPSGPAARVAARQGRIHDRKTRHHHCVIVLANWGWSIHVILFQQYRADQPNDRCFVGEYADDIGSALHLLIQPFQRICIWYSGAGFRRVHLEGGA